MGLRELKKEQTRELIADTAWLLFADRGALEGMVARAEIEERAVAITERWVEAPREQIGEAECARIRMRGVPEAHKPTFVARIPERAADERQQCRETVVSAEFVDTRAADRSLEADDCVRDGDEQQVTVAEQLNDARMNEIRDALKAVTGKDVKLDLTVDPSIIGGLKVKVGSRMVDASLRTKLNSIKFAMKEAR